MKHTIEIDCQKNDCGKCTYWSSKKRNLNGYCVTDFTCMLFNRFIGTGSKERCHDCKLLTSRFNKMPELEEGV